MMTKTLRNPMSMIAALALSACTAPAPQAYFGLAPPRQVPERFAPGRISLVNRHEFGSVFSANGSEFYFGVDRGGRAEIYQSRLEGDSWTQPARLLANARWSHNDPFLSPDESRLFFISDRPHSGIGAKADNFDIWYIQRTGTGGGSWGEPVNAGTAVNSPSNEYYVSFTDDGTLYFASDRAAKRRGDFDLYAARADGSRWLPAARLPGAVNGPSYEADAFVSPDGSYLVFSSQRRAGHGRGDLYISRRRADGSWGRAANLGATINSDGHELCPFVTRDGRFLFYTSREDIYWIDAAILDRR